MPDFIIVKRKRKDYEQYTCRIEVELLEKLKTIVYENNLDSVNELVNKINSKEYLEYHINCFDLYDLMIQSLKEEDILDDILDMEETDGYSDVSNTIQDTMGINSLNDNYIINTIKKNIDDKSIVFITGVGKAYPIIRAHKVLKNTHLEIDNVPVVIFLPGKYSGLEISLFGKLNTNYYRAFKLID